MKVSRIGYVVSGVNGELGIGRLHWFWSSQMKPTSSLVAYLRAPMDILLTVYWCGSQNSRNLEHGTAIILHSLPFQEFLGQRSFRHRPSSSMDSGILTELSIERFHQNQRANKSRMINCLPLLPAPSRKSHDNSTFNPQPKPRPIADDRPWALDNNN